MEGIKIEMEDLINILVELKPGVDFEEEENLIEDGILDSFDIVNLVAKNRRRIRSGNNTSRFNTRKFLIC